ncbi:MAG: SLC13 family permease [Chloroflexi bacterium]|nr:SLC13 family permease [Chloroflexota bacterium]
MLALFAGVLIFGATLVVIMARPYGIPEAAAATVGAALVVLIGLVQPDEALRVLIEQWNVFGFLLGLMTISAMADQEGIFERIADQAGRWGRGDAARLYLIIFLVGALITAFLSNDATALVLTPLVYALVTRLRLPVLPFMFACTFVADTASFLLPVSNPINILVLGSFPSDLALFLRYLLLPSVFCIGWNAVTFIWRFHDDLDLSYALDPPSRREEPPRQSRFALGVLALIALAFVVASALRLPLSAVALAGAATLVAGAARRRRLEWRKLRDEISWSLFILIGGLFILVRGIENLGLTAAFGSALLNLAGADPLREIVVTAAGTALGSNLVNNVPMALVMTSALHSIPGVVAANPGLAYATILGADLGPNITTVGSLATILWVLILRRKGLQVSTVEYFKLGLLNVPVMLVIGSILIWLHW